MKTIILCILVLIVAVGHLSCEKQKEILYVGTYSQRESQGIYVYEFDRISSTFNLLQTKPEIANPNFLVIHPSGGFLYSVNKIIGEDGKNQDAISSFAINQDDGTLSLINQIPTYGRGACHVSTDQSGRWVLVSHYTSGSLSVFPVNNDGSLGDTIQSVRFEGSSISRRQQGPHVHSVLVSPDNKYVYVADLGTDKVMIYVLDQNTGKLTAASDPWGSANPGSGPRHFTFHPVNSFFYLAEELSSSVSVFDRDKSTGALTSVQTLSSLPEGFNGHNSVADIHTDPDGNYLYVTNRGHNSLAIFSIQDNGKIELIGHEPVRGDHPRNFMVDPKGEFLMVANQNTDNIVLFQIDKSTGLLQYSGVTLEVPAAVCLKWHIL